MTTTKQVIEEYRKQFRGMNRDELMWPIEAFLTSKLELRTKEIIELVEKNDCACDHCLSETITTLKSTYL